MKTQGLLALRYLILIVPFGALVSSLTLFGLAAGKVGSSAYKLITSGPAASREIIAGLMSATDVLLFGMVLVIFAYAITFGFVFQLPREAQERLPSWMREHEIGHLKRVFLEVIIIYLAGDTVTDFAQEETLSWFLLVKPGAAALLGVTLWLMQLSMKGTEHSGAAA